MTKWFLFFGLVATCLGQIALNDGVISRVTTATGGVDITKNLQFYLNSPVAAMNLNFTLFACFGQLDWILGYGFAPTAANNSCNAPWPGADVRISEFFE
jgi:hypothetical protein